MPIRSSEYVARSIGIWGKTFQAMNAAANATGRLAKKIQRQPMVSIRKPPKDGPVIYPR